MRFSIYNTKVARQSVIHFHCHVIPRYKGDMKNPKRRNKTLC
ncbi:HIT domain-containing protein [Algibacter lectus]|nr:HIT domain-containing protein [Algibacter lectus]MDO7138146.1 HIT domain-containing protein [Algibacter lectus]